MEKKDKEKIKTFINQKILVDRKIRRENRLKSSINWAKQKGIEEENYPSYIASWMTYLLFGFVAILISYFTIDLFLKKHTGLNETFRGILSFIIPTLLYVIEFFNIRELTRKFHHGMDKGFHFLLAIVIAVMNVLIVTIGVYVSFKNYDSSIKQIAVNVNNDSLRIAKRYDSLINEAAVNIRDIKTNAVKQWKGVLTSQDKDMIATNLELIKDYESQRVDAIAAIANNKSETITEAESSNNLYIFIMIVVGIIIEMIIIFCIRNTAQYHLDIEAHYEMEERIQNQQTNQTIPLKNLRGAQVN